MSQIIAPVEYTVGSDEQVAFAGLQSGTCSNREDPITLDELEEDPNKLGFVFLKSDSRGNKLFDCYQEPEANSSENAESLIRAGRNPMTREEFENPQSALSYIPQLRDPRIRAEQIRRDKKRQARREQQNEQERVRREQESLRREEEMRNQYNTTMTLVVDGVENNFTISQNCSFQTYADNTRFYDLQPRAVELIFGEGVKQVNFTDSNWVMLRRVVFPDSVERIRLAAFREAVLLEKINLPRGLKTLGMGAFLGCTNLKTVYFNSNVDVIERFAFFQCSALKTVVFNGAVSLITSEAFRDCTRLRAVTVPIRTIVEENAFDANVVITRRQVREIDDDDNGPPRQRMAIGAVLNWMNSDTHKKIYTGERLIEFPAI